MSNAKETSRKRVPVKSQNHQIQEVTTTIRIPKSTPQARRIRTVISALWPRAVVCRTTLHGILARLELVGMHLSCQASEGDSMYQVLDELMDKARKDLSDLLAESRQDSLKLIAGELDMTQNQVEKCGRAGGFLGF